MRYVVVVAAGLLYSSQAFANPAECSRAPADAAMITLKLNGEAQRQRLAALQSGRPQEPYQISREDFERVTELYRRYCRKGDTIDIDSEWERIVKDVCDFSKSIVRQGDDTLCVMK